MSAQTVEPTLAPAPEETTVPKTPARKRSILRIAIAVVISVVALVGLFASYEVWGTSLAESRAQQLLLARYRQELPTTVLDDPTAPVTRGDPIALLVVPSIGLSQVVIEGSSPSELNQGPGHVPATPLPGEFGNSVVLGRRVSYGAPFASLAALHAGDEIQVTTGQGAFAYKVKDVQSLPESDPSITAGRGQSELTLVTAGPLRSPGERTVVTASLEGDPGALATRPQAFVDAADLGGGDLAGGTLRVVWWGAVMALAVWGSMRLYRVWPARAAFLAAIPVLTLVTWQLFNAIGRMAPGVL